MIVVLEGLDGSGKRTQVERIRERLKREGRKVRVISFPRYDSKSSDLVKGYLRGDFGSEANKISGHLASLFFVIDRAITMRDIEIEEDEIVIFDRYISSNIVYQGSKFESAEKREEYIRWLYDLEVGVLGLPKEDLVIALQVPVEKSVENVLKRGWDRDIHETDIEYLKNCAKMLEEGIEKLGWKAVECFEGGRMRNEREIEEEIVGVIRAWEREKN